MKIKFNQAFHKKILEVSLLDCKTEKERQQILKIMKKKLNKFNVHDYDNK